jgi:hypothetical protein
LSASAAGDFSFYIIQCNSTDIIFKVRLHRASGAINAPGSSTGLPGARFTTLGRFTILEIIELAGGCCAKAAPVHGKSAEAEAQIVGNAFFASSGN